MAVTKKVKTGTKAAAEKGVARAGTATATKAQPAARKPAAPKPASSSASAAVAPRKAAPIKVNDRQREFLKKIQDAGEAGYEAGPSYEQRTIDALVERKLAKKGARDKQSGKSRFLLTRAGEKHLTTAAPSAAS